MTNALESWLQTPTGKSGPRNPTGGYVRTSWRRPLPSTSTKLRPVEEISAIHAPSGDGKKRRLLPAGMRRAFSDVSASTRYTPSGTACDSPSPWTLYVQPLCSRRCVPGIHSSCGMLVDSVSEASSRRRSSSAEISSRGFSPFRSTAQSEDCSYQSSSDRRTSVRRRKATTWPSPLIVTLIASSASKRVWVLRVASSQTSRSPSLTNTTTAVSPDPGTCDGAVESAAGFVASGSVEDVEAGAGVVLGGEQADKIRAARRNNPRDRNGRFT